MRIAACIFLLSSTVVGNDVVGIAHQKPAEGRSVATDSGFMIPYEMEIPGTKVTFRMQPIPAGEFLMGSPENEAGRESFEGPQRKVHVDAFWMSECEITWGEYIQYMDLYTAFKDFETKGIRPVTDDNRVDAVTAPTPLYEPDFTYEHGNDPRQPAVTITQYSAKQYTKWLSAITQLQHRLPTEAEWEYACRAGTTTAWSFGNDAEKLAEHAWFAGNTEQSGARFVGLKKPNPWGLYDMYGNAAEWVLDGFAPYQVSDKLVNGTQDWVRTDSLDARVVRGGTWEFPAEQCRSASRYASDHEAWREYDPNLPKSPWWFTTDPARGVGFRIMRPLRQVSRAEIEEVWRIDNEDTQFDVDDRLLEGRGVMGLVDPDLPAALRKLQE